MTLVVGTWLVGMVENFEVVVINVVASKDIGDEFQQGGLSDASLSNQKEGVWPLRPVLRCLNDPPLNGIYVASQFGQDYHVEEAVDLLESQGVTLVLVFQGILARAIRCIRCAIGG